MPPKASPYPIPRWCRQEHSHLHSVCLVRASASFTLQTTRADNTDTGRPGQMPPPPPFGIPPPGAPGAPGMPPRKSTLSQHRQMHNAYITSAKNARLTTLTAPGAHGLPFPPPFPPHNASGTPPQGGFPPPPMPNMPPGGPGNLPPPPGGFPPPNFPVPPPGAAGAFPPPMPGHSGASNSPIPTGPRGGDRYAPPPGSGPPPPGMDQKW